MTEPRIPLLPIDEAKQAASEAGSSRGHRRAQHLPYSPSATPPLAKRHQ